MDADTIARAVQIEVGELHVAVDKLGIAFFGETVNALNEFRNFRRILW